MSALIGKRVLILEDEYLLAMEAAETLEELGAVVVGPAHRVEAAKVLVLGGNIDVALLDMNINGEPSSPIAELLSACGVPYVYATGYGAAADVPKGVMIVDKPYTREEIETALTSVLSTHKTSVA